MNNEILTSEDIDSALKPYSIFKGAFPSDSISMFCLSEKQAFIINTAKSGKPGEHWVGLILDGPICNYFDSFGLEILNLDVLNTLKYSGITKYVFNSNQIQLNSKQKTSVPELKSVDRNSRHCRKRRSV